MTTQTVDDLVEEYLRRLTAAADAMPPGQRAELLDDIRAHIASARAAGAQDEAAVRMLLDRLGDPEEIVAAGTEAARPGSSAAPPGSSAAPPGPPPGAPPTLAPGMRLRQPTAAREILAVVLMTLGSFIPVLGWLAGIIIAWTSRRWRLGEKLLATLIVPGGPGLIGLLAAVPTQTCTTSPTDPLTGSGSGAETCEGSSLPPYIGGPLLLLAVFGPLVVAGILLHRAVARAAAEPPVAAPLSPWGPREIAAVLLLGPAGLVLPVVAPASGLLFAWFSDRWSVRHKRLATALALAPVTVALVAVLLLAR